MQAPVPEVIENTITSLVRAYVVGYDDENGRDSYHTLTIEQFQPGIGSARIRLSPEAQRELIQFIIHSHLADDVLEPLFGSDLPPDAA